MSSTRNFININNKYDRVVLLVDMDCFYCQVEEKLDPSLAGKPIAVVQYNAWRGGGIIAVNYAARAKGVTRHMRGDEAKEQCPEIELVRVPNVREKADLSKYRDAGKDVANVLQKFTNLLERASVDEAYLDITTEVNKRMENLNAGTFLLQPEIFVNTYAVGYESIGQYVSEITSKISHPYDDDDYSLAFDPDDSPAVRKSDLRLLIGAAIASEIRAAVKKGTSYECSAGIAHNKILAKLGCGMNKPNKQTILPLSQISQLFRTLPVSKIKGLGGKFGFELCERLKINYLGDLVNFSEADLQRKLDEKNGSWVYLMCRGIDLEAVTPRFYSKSIGCCKKFPGRNSITGLKSLEHWLTELGNEIAERLEKDFEENNRRAKQMVVGYIQEINSEDISSSRSAPLAAYDSGSIQKAALEIIKRNTDQFIKPGSDLVLNNAIKFLSISVGKFESNHNVNEQNTLQQMFAKQKKKEPQTSGINLNMKNDPSNQSRRTINSLEIMLANHKVREPKAFDKNENTKAEHREIAKANDLGHSEYSNSRTTAKTQKSKPRSFFADRINRIRARLSEEEKPATPVEEDNLFCDEAVLKSKNVHTDETMAETHKLKSKSFFEARMNEIKRGQSEDEKAITLVEEDNLFCDVALQQTESSHSDETVAEIEKPKPRSFFAAHIDRIRRRQSEEEKSVTVVEEDNLFCDEALPKSEENSVSAPNEESPIKQKPTSNSLFARAIKPAVQPDTPPKSLKRKSDSPEASTSSAINNSYQTEYPELATPELREEFFIKCETCRQRILSDEASIQSHQDQHLAEELSRQQREDYRKEVQSKITQSAQQKMSKATITTPHASKKAKINSPKAAASIKKFMQPLTQTEDDVQSSSSQVTCDKCSKAMARDLMAEHLDYHYAKDLQLSLNRSDMITVRVGGGSSLKKNVKSPGVIKKASSSSVAATKSKSITQFFSQM